MLWYKVCAQSTLLHEIVVWLILIIQNGINLVYIQLYLDSFPFFAIKNFPDIMKILFSNRESHIETWVPEAS